MNKEVYLIYQDDICEGNIDSTIISVNSTNYLAEIAFNIAIDNVVTNWDTTQDYIEENKCDSFYMIENSHTNERIEISIKKMKVDEIFC